MLGRHRPAAPAGPDPTPHPSDDAIQLALRDAAISDAVHVVDRALVQHRRNPAALVDALLDVRSTLQHGRG